MGPHCTDKEKAEFQALIQRIEREHRVKMGWGATYLDRSVKHDQ